jgi:deferrochelatase/peroxidase EfeB
VPATLDQGGILPPLNNPYHSAQLKDMGRNGSYVVYRKLEQDVAGFWEFMKGEAILITGSADTEYMTWLASRCVGRWPSGAPLVLTPDIDDRTLGNRDDFLYGDDVEGLACPFGSHIRRTNPRDVVRPYPTEQSLSMSEAHRLLRRARVFGSAPVDAPRGIHFFCVNASIKTQFEFVQQTWCNNPRFAGLNDNKDPIIGDNARTDQTPSRMTIPRRPFTVRTSALPRFVKVRAGMYLFMPSLTALRFLARS